MKRSCWLKAGGFQDSSRRTSPTVGERVSWLFLVIQWKRNVGGDRGERAFTGRYWRGRMNCRLWGGSGIGWAEM